MSLFPPHAIADRLRQRIARLYPGQAERCIARLNLRLARHLERAPPPAGERWTPRSSLVIAYADTIRAPGEAPLHTLERFLRTHLAGTVSAVHVLPFFPSSSDDGFAVIHYRRVDPEVGDWDAVRTLANTFDLMTDLVLNHVSSQSGWFADYRLGIAPGRNYFIAADPAQDLAAVARPRTSPLLTPVNTRHGVRHVWTTFGADQVDLNYAEPDVLFEILDILSFYIEQGAHMIRLDAVAYLWKQLGTSCIHRPETHEIVKVLRDWVDLTAPGVALVTETNVPHEDNVRYFGEGDEAHLVYQFSLPPLLLHALLSGNAALLTRWASALDAPPLGCAFLNFTASHDGIGLRPLEGLLPAADILALAEHVERRGGRISQRSAPDGSAAPYELNITFSAALRESEAADPARRIARFLCSQAVSFALQGIPAVYFNGLLAAPNDLDGVVRTNRARSINRHKWREQEVQALLDDACSEAALAFAGIRRLLRIRAAHEAFHPDSPQKILDWGPDVFALRRTARDGSETIIAVNNVTPQSVDVPVGRDLSAAGPAGRWINLLGDGPVFPAPDRLRLNPYEALWLKTPVG